MATETSTGIRAGYTSITPYITVERAPELIDFVKQAFDAVETFRGTGSAGGLHAEVRIGNSMVMIGGGPGIEPKPASIHLFVDDVDATYRRALQAGATSIGQPTDHDYGERGASLQDAFGNHWYLARSLSGPPIPEGFRTVTPYLHPHNAAGLIDFLKQVFGAEEVARYADASGSVAHARLRIGDSMIELGEAHGPCTPMATAIYLYVPDVDAAYHRALDAGATSITSPADQPYGDRNGGVKDPFGHTWYIATPVSK